MVKYLITMILLLFSSISLAEERLVYDLSVNSGEGMNKSAESSSLGSGFVASMSDFFMGKKNYKVLFKIDKTKKKGVEFYYLESHLIDGDKGTVIDSEVKASLYDKKTGGLNSTQIMSPKSMGSVVRYKAIVRQGIDDWTDEEISEIYSKNYSQNGIKVDKDGRFNENLNQLMSRDLALDTYGFLLYLYKYKFEDSEKVFYYVDKGFLKKVKLKLNHNSSKREDPTEKYVSAKTETVSTNSRIKNVDDNLVSYSVIYNNDLCIMTIWIDSVSRKPVRVEMDNMILTLSIR